jgi:hypothetical protein
MMSTCAAGQDEDGGVRLLTNGPQPRARCPPAVFDHSALQLVGDMEALWWC